MRTNTLVTLGASAAFGIMAVVLARGWISGAVEDEFRASLPTQPQFLQDAMGDLPAADMRTVWVANADLTFGDYLSEEVLRPVDYPEDSIPLGAFETLGEIMSADTDQPTIVLSDIRMNEIVLPHKISGPGARAILSTKIKPGYRAVSVRVDDVSGVAGFVLPGDLVDVLFTTEPDPDSEIPSFANVILLSAVRVLGTDQSMSDGASTPDVARTVTLEVPPQDTQRLSLAQQNGVLSLVLRGTGELSPASTAQLSSDDLLRPTRTAPQRRSAPSTRQTPKPTPKLAKAKITIHRGEESESVSVLREDLPATQSELILELAGG